MLSSETQSPAVYRPYFKTLQWPINALLFYRYVTNEHCLWKVRRGLLLQFIFCAGSVRESPGMRNRTDSPPQRLNKPRHSVWHLRGFCQWRSVLCTVHFKCPKNWIIRFVGCTTAYNKSLISSSRGAISLLRWVVQEMPLRILQYAQDAHGKNEEICRQVSRHVFNPSLQIASTPPFSCLFFFFLRLPSSLHSPKTWMLINHHLPPTGTFRCREGGASGAVLSTDWEVLSWIK